MYVYMLSSNKLCMVHQESGHCLSPEHNQLHLQRRSINALSDNTSSQTQHSSIPTRSLGLRWCGFGSVRFFRFRIGPRFEFARFAEPNDRNVGPILRKLNESIDVDSRWGLGSGVDMTASHVFSENLMVHSSIDPP